MKIKGVIDHSIFFIMILKAIRVFMFGLLSIILPNFLLYSGFSSLDAGLIITASIISSSMMNILTGLFARGKNTYNLMMIFSIFIVISGMSLFSFNRYLIIFGSIIGMISATGTETGPFGSLEQALIPKFVKGEYTTFYYSIYNIIGYLFSVLGNYSVYFTGNPSAFRFYFIIYSLSGLFFIIIYTIIKNNLYYDADGKLKKTVNEETKRIALYTGILFSIDSFAGGFIIQSILALWLKHFFDVDMNLQGIILGTGGLITVISLYITPGIAKRFGLLNTMVLSHILSNIFLISITFLNSLYSVILLLYLRQAFSQMDVPTRQSFFMKIIDKNDRTYFSSFTNMPRGFAQAGSPWIAGLLISMNLLAAPFIISGSLKIVYDLAIFSIFKNYRNIK
ncbi:MAG: MFS transporter [Thermoplasmata archaeon]